MGDFKELKVWQRARDMTLAVYSATQCFPPSEQFGLTSQLRRASVSIGANIAESRGRRTLRDQHRFLHIAQGPAREVESHLILARDLQLLNPEQSTALLNQISEVQRMLSAFIGSSPASR